MAGAKLVRYDAMCRAIAEAHKVDEVKDIRDKALMLEMYQRQAQNTDAEQDACEIRLRAERKAGQLLKQKEKQHGARGVGKKVEYHDGTPLSKLGISKKQSSAWQKLADVPDEQFELAVTDRTRRATTNGIIRETTPPKVVQVSAEAIRLWGEVCDLTTPEWLSRSPAEVMSTMTPQMLDDVHERVPRLIAWLKRIGETA